MKKNRQSFRLFAATLLLLSAPCGCSMFRSPSADYKAPGEEYCTDVSRLPDPNEKKKDADSITIRNIANQYGRGGKIEESPERLQLQADSYFEQKRYHDASRLYKKYLATPAAATTPPEILAVMHYRIGFVESKRMFFAKAQAEYEQAVKYAPESPSRPLLKSPPAMHQLPASYSRCMSPSSSFSCSVAMVPSEV